MGDYQTDPIQGAAAYAALKSLETSTGKAPIGFLGSALADAAMIALGDAEFLAADAGVIPWIPMTGSDKGITIVGGASSVPPENWPEGVRSIYIAQHRIWNAIHGGAQPLQKNTTILDVPGIAPPQMKGPHVLILIGVLGIAAIIGGAYYATHTQEKWIEVQGENIRAMGKLTSIVDIARAELRTKGKVSKATLGALSNVGPPKASTLGAAALVGMGAAGIVGVAAGGYFLNKKYHIIK